MLKDPNIPYEPTYAIGNFGCLYRLQYQGFYKWRIDVRDAKNNWNKGKSITHEELIKWGNEKKLEYQHGMVRDLGIRFAGEESTNLRLLGCNARQLGHNEMPEYHIVWGNRRHCNVRRTVYGEHAPNGTVRVWLMMGGLFRAPQRTMLGEGFFELADLREGLIKIDKNDPAIDSSQLRALFRPILTERLHLKNVKHRLQAR